MGGDRFSVCVRIDVLRNLGHRREDLCQRDPIFEYAGGRQLCSPGAWFRKWRSRFYRVSLILSSQFTNWLVAILTPILLDKSAYGAYFLFGALALGTVAVLAVYMPETRGRSLEDIQDAFHTPGLKSLSGYLRRRAPRSGVSDNDTIELSRAGAAQTSTTSSSETAMMGLRLDITSN
jgi:hypothetical protein